VLFLASIVCAREKKNKKTDLTVASSHRASLGPRDKEDEWWTSAPFRPAPELVKLVAHLGNTYGLDPGDSLDLYYACSGDGAVADQAARLGTYDGHLVQIPSEYVALIRKVWTFKDDQMVLNGSKAERAELEEKRGRGSVAARRRFLEKHKNWSRRARWPVDASALD
jgi:hypothetical protein